MITQEKRLSPRPPMPKEQRDWLKAEIDRKRRTKAGVKGNKKPNKGSVRHNPYLDMADGDPYVALALAISVHKGDE